MCRLLFAASVVALVLLILAVKYLPLWAVFAGLLALAVVARLLVPRLIRSLFLIPFRAKGAVLRGASIEVHGVECVPEPVRTQDREDEVVECVDEDDEEPEGDAHPVGVPLEYYRLDVTITPKPPTGKLTLWEPSELILVPFDAPTTADDDLEGGACVEQIEVFTEGAFGPDEPGKYEGTQRIRATFGLPEGSPRRMKLCYDLEAFGDVTLPTPAPAAAPEQPA